MAAVVSGEGFEFDTSVALMIAGGGACGLVAALAAHDAGIAPLVLERDAALRGSTSLSSGMIPACNTAIQKSHGIEDSVAVMAADIQRKAHNRNDAQLVDAICRESGPAIDWLTGTHGIDLRLVEGFLYPGHSVMRMHAPPDKTGAALMASLQAAAARAGIDIVTRAYVRDLFSDAAGRVLGVSIERPSGGTELIGCQTLVLACNGFGGNPKMVNRFIPEMNGAQYFGHPGNTGEAVQWGEAMEAALDRMGAYQGHGSVADPHAILITWALMMEGGIQVNIDGRRFSNEHGGYSEQAVKVLDQPEGTAFDIYDERLHRLGLTFEDYRNAVNAGAIRRADDIAGLAELLDIPPHGLASTLRDVAAMQSGQMQDPYGRDFTTKPMLQPPYYAVRVTGALFHTQGGLRVDRQARVVRQDSSTLPNLFAGGGAAAGVSGETVDGYLSGNGLLAAVTLGRIAGRSAAEQVKRELSAA